MTVPTVMEARRSAAANAANLLRLGIENIYLIGSVARGLADESSDFDFACEAPSFRTDDFTLNKKMSPLFGRPIDAREIGGRASSALLPLVLPHAVLIFGKKPPAQAFAEYCGGSKMSSDKTEDLQTVLRELLDEAIPNFREDIRDGGDIQTLSEPRNKNERRMAAAIGENISRFNEALNRGSMSPLRRQTADIMPTEGWNALAQAAIPARHFYAGTPYHRMDLIAEFHEKWFEKMAQAAKQMLRILKARREKTGE